MVSPGATARSSGTSSTVRSSGLPSSGAMNRSARSQVAGGPPRRSGGGCVTSIQPQSRSRPLGQRRGAGRRARASRSTRCSATRCNRGGSAAWSPGCGDDVPPGEDLVAGERAAAGIEARGDGVAGIARRSRGGAAQVRRAAHGRSRRRGAGARRENAAPPSTSRATSAAERPNTRQSYTRHRARHCGTAAAAQV